MSRGFPLRSISRGRSRVVARSSEAPRGRAWRRPAACRPISILRGCSGCCRARARFSSCRAISAATGSALRRGRGGRCWARAEGGDAISGNAELRSSIAIVTFRDGLGRSIRLVVLVAGCGKLGVWRKSPRSQLETRDPCQLNQWVAATLRGTDCSENSTDRLFPQPARFSLPVFCSKRKGRSSSVAAIGFTACAEGVKGAARRRSAAWISQRCDARARGAGLRNLPRCPIPLSVSS